MKRMPPFIIPDLPAVLSYYAPLRQVFQNLISNSLKYHQKGRDVEINIRAEETATHWKFAISDNGIGIEPEYHERVFVIFQRLHNREEYSGTGIGLAIVKKIIESLSGEINIQSTHGEGTTFEFSIGKLNASTELPIINK